MEEILDTKRRSYIEKHKDGFAASPHTLKWM